MKKLKLLISLSVALGLVGCSMGHDELEKLCKKDAGTVIYKQVKADGYYDNNCTGACWLPLLDGSYKFIEIHNPTDKNHYNPGKGFWRIYISNRNDENCYSMVTNRQRHRIGNGQCIAFKKLSKVMARYRLNTEETFIYLDNYYKSKVVRQTQAIIDSKTQEALGLNISYYLDINPDSTGDGGPYQCKSISSGKMEFKSLSRSVFKESS